MSDHPQPPPAAPVLPDAAAEAHPAVDANFLGAALRKLRGEARVFVVAIGEAGVELQHLAQRARNAVHRGARIEPAPAQNAAQPQRARDEKGAARTAGGGLQRSRLGGGVGEHRGGGRGLRVVGHGTGN